MDECYKLMVELGREYQGNKQFNKRKYGSVPSSPNGVMDVSFSCDSSNESWAVAASSVSSSPEPVSKKSRAQDQLLLSHPNSDFLRIPP